MPWRTNRVAFETQLSDIIRCSSVLSSGSLAILSQLQFWLWQIGFRHSLPSPSEIRIPGLQTKENPKPMCKMWDMPAPDSVKNLAGLEFNKSTSIRVTQTDVAQGAHIRMTPGWGLLPGQLPDRTGHTASGLRLASSAGTLVVFTRTHTPGRSKQKITIMLPYLLPYLHVLLCKLWFGQACFESCYDDYYC